MSLEQPTNSMAWLEPVATHFLKEIQADLVHVAACSVDLDMHKSWIFATCYRPLQALAAICPHARGTHEDIRGTRDSAGGFCSRASAEYPLALAVSYAAQTAGLFPLVTGTGQSLSLRKAPLLSLPKGAKDPPVSVQEGAGIFSVPDWSFPPQDSKDVFASLRPRLLDFLLRHRHPSRLRELCEVNSESSLFTPEEVIGLRRVFEHWLASEHPTRQVSWHVAPNQPYCLDALQLFSSLRLDRGTTLFPCLQAGVPTGFDADIPLSNVLVPQGSAHPSAQDLSICNGNWSSAEADHGTLHELVQEELNKGWLFEMDSLASAQSRFGDKLAIGKMSIVRAAGKKPRLVVDSTVCGTNPACVIPETFGLPSVDDVRDSFPLRLHCGKLSGFALDVKSAHKTVRVRPSDQGLLGITLPAADGSGPRYLFYQVCPFGANFSALWCQRLGSFFIRVLHLWIWLRHAFFGYVDDFLLLQDEEVIALFAALTLAFCAMFVVPVSNSKLQLGRGIIWIGWHFGFGSGTFSVPPDKCAKLKRLLQEALSSRHVHRRAMDKILGLLQWLCKLYRSFEPWLQPLYADANRALATNHSIAPGDWPGLAIFLHDSLTFTATPPGTSITPGSRLLEARHMALSSKRYLAKVPTSKRIWMRISDPSTTRRKLSCSSRTSLDFWLTWCDLPPLFFPLQKPPPAPIQLAAADARANGDIIGIGGFIQWSDGPCAWFSETWTLDDLASLGLPLQRPAHRNITCYEALAQLGLMLCLRSVVPSARWAVRLRTLSDNTGAEAGINKLYSSQYPLSAFLQRLCMLACLTGIELDVGRVPGEKNNDADRLSRWDDPTVPLAQKFQDDYRVDCGLDRIWFFRSDVRLFPSDAFLKWKPP